MIGTFAFIYSKNKAVKQHNYGKTHHNNKRPFKLTSFVIDLLGSFPVLISDEYLKQLIFS